MGRLSLTVLLLTAAVAGVSWWEEVSGDEEPTARSPGSGPPTPSSAGPIWRGETEFDGGNTLVVAVETPAGLASRLGVEGTVLRLVLEVRGTSGVRILGARLEEGQDGPLAQPLEAAKIRFAPLARLLGFEALDLEPGTPRPLFLHGRAPEGQDLACVLERTGGRPVRVELRPVEPVRNTAALARLASAVPGPSTDPRDAEIVRLREELEAERRERRERELSWFRYNQALARLDWRAPRFDIDEALLPPGLLEASPPAPVDAPDPRTAELRERARQIGVSLRTLFRLEGLNGMDLLETGTLGDGVIGPVVFRLLDERGRLTGSLTARRLRLEGSRAARTVTVVLEDGSETHRGEEIPFRGGVRRIVLAEVDPEPWMDSVPELFSEEDLDPATDDGRWNLGELRRTLNRLLGEQADAGFLRMRSLTGVVGDTFVGVHLEEFDGEGHLRSRLFADRMRIVPRQKGLVLELWDGAVLRGERRIAFRDGLHRVFLPRADAEAWRRAPVPMADPAPPSAEASAGGERG